MPRKYTPDEAVAAFWSKVNKDGPTQPHMTTPCWVWTAASWKGYGLVKIRRRMTPAHRAAYEMTHGAIPVGLFACHHCDHRPCVRPDHLFIGNNAANVADMVAKGRQARGDRSSSVRHPERLKRGDDHPARINPSYIWRGEDFAHAKLTEATVREIRAVGAAGHDLRGMAALYGVTETTIRQAISRKTWRHVE